MLSAMPSVRRKTWGTFLHARAHFEDVGIGTMEGGSILGLLEIQSHQQGSVLTASGYEESWQLFQIR